MPAPDAIGGFVKQYQVQPDPAKLVGYGLSLRQMIDAIEANSASRGANYIEHNGEGCVIRTAGHVEQRRPPRGSRHGHRPSETETFWTAFLRVLARRELCGVKLVISDADEGIKASVSKVLSASRQAAFDRSDRAAQWRDQAPASSEMTACRNGFTVSAKSP